MSDAGGGDGVTGKNSTTERLAEQALLLSARADVFSSPLCAAGDTDADDSQAGSLPVVLMAVSDAELLEFHAHAVQVLRLAEAAVVAAAGEVARRSAAGVPDPLARRLGERSPAGLLAARSGQHEIDAAAHVRLGVKLAPRAGLTGGVLPPFFARVAAAVQDGGLGVRSAKVIVGALERIEPHATTTELLDAERVLVAGAMGEWSGRTVQQVCRVLPDRFDPDGIELREAALRTRRGARRSVLEDGTVRWVLNLDPESAAYLDAAIDARTAPRRQVSFATTDDDHNHDTGADAAEGDPAEAVFVDTRTWEQKRVDAFVDIARDSLRADDGQVGGLDTTAVIHIPIELLTDTTGNQARRDGLTARFEGIDTPVSAGTARRIATVGNIIGLVIGPDRQPLELGRTSRFFTPAQRRVMAARDHGCLWPGCTAPPRRCDAAHILGWLQHGPTNPDNGILLCHFHHRRFDEDGWQFHWHDTRPWFTPPAHVDATRRPRQGGHTPLDALSASTTRTT